MDQLTTTLFSNHIELCFHMGHDWPRGLGSPTWIDRCNLCICKLAIGEYKSEKSYIDYVHVHDVQIQ
jgi:hypothetical protein